MGIGSDPPRGPLFLTRPVRSGCPVVSTLPGHQLRFPRPTKRLRACLAHMLITIGGTSRGGYDRKNTVHRRYIQQPCSQPTSSRGRVVLNAVPVHKFMKIAGR